MYNQYTIYNVNCPYMYIAQGFRDEFLHFWTLLLHCRLLEDDSEEDEAYDSVNNKDSKDLGADEDDPMFKDDRL